MKKMFPTKKNVDLLINAEHNHCCKQIVMDLIKDKEGEYLGLIYLDDDNKLVGITYLKESFLLMSHESDDYILSRHFYNA